MSQAGALSGSGGGSGGTTSFVCNTGTATPSAGVIDILGGSGASTTGSGNTITVTAAGGGITGPGTTVVGDIVLWNSTTGAVVSDAGFGFPLAVAHGGTGDITLTAHAVLLGEGTSAISSVGPGTNGQVLLGTTSADPTFVTPTAGTGLSVTTNATTLSYALTTPVTVPNGGTGAGSFTAHGVMLGEGTSALSVTAVGTNGQVLLGTSAADPTWVTPTAGTGLSITTNATTLQYALSTPVTAANGGTGVGSPTAHTLPVAEGSSAFNFLGPLTNGQLLIGSTGADPVAATLTAGSNVTITNGAGTITIASSGGGGGGLTWNDESTSFSAAATNGYFVTGTASATLPASPSQGNTIAFATDATNILTITANTGQTIRVGNNVSASAGTCANTLRGDSITLVYRSSDTTWLATSVIGEWQLT